MVNRKTVSALTIATLLACSVPLKSVASALMTPVIGQAAPSFSVPTSVEKGTEVKISSSSDNMNAISEALKAGFEGEYDNSKVVVGTKDANTAIQDVLNGNADLAAISRPLTAEEKAKGLIEVPVRREKIAIVVSKDNAFAESITGSQFAQIFRGEIKDWSAVGGEAGPIKLIDRPANSETRQALSPYPVFTTAPFTATTDATTLEADTTEALVKALGADGIGYVLVGELAGQPELKALQLHKTPPSDPRYPFSQPYSFVYAGGASPAVSAFLGYATGNPGQAVVNDAGVSGLGLIPDATSGNAAPTSVNESATGANSPDTSAAEGSDSSDAADTDATDTEGASSPSTESSTAPDAPPAGNAGNGETLEARKVTVPGPDGDINIAGPDGILGTADDVRLAGPDGKLGTPDDIDIAGPDGVVGTADDIDLAGPDGAFGTADDLKVDVNGAAASGGLGRLASKGRWWWLLLPLAGLGLLIWAAGKRGSEEETGYVANVNRDDRIRSNFDGDADFKAGRGTAGLGELDADLPDGQVRGKGLGLSKVAAGGAAIAGGAAAAGAGLAGRVKGKAGDVAMDVKDGVSGTVRGGVGSVKDGVQGGVDGIKGGVDGIKGKAQGSIDGVRSSVEGSVEGVKGSFDGVKGSVQSGVQGGVDGIKGAGAAGLGAGAAGLGAGAAALGGLRDQAQGGLDGVKNSVQGQIDGAKGYANSAKDSVQGQIDGRVEGAKGALGDIKDNAQSGGSSWLDRAKQRINEAAEQVKDDAANLKDDLTNKD